MLPFGFIGLLLIGVTAVAGDGRITAADVSVMTSVLLAVLCYLAEPLAAPPLAIIGWFTVAAFSRPVYGDLHAGATAPAAGVLLGCAAAATSAGVMTRRVRIVAAYRVLPPGGQSTLHGVTAQTPGRNTSEHTGSAAAVRWSRPRSAASGISRRRQLSGLGLAVAALPALTALLAAAQPHLVLVDDVLFYLVAVLAVTLLGGFWPAVAAAVTAALLLNWYFTPPLHTWTIDAPQNILALLLFVTVAVAVSSVVHLAARRDTLAVQRAADADALSTLAQTILAGDDNPYAVLEHLSRTLGLSAELRERRGAEWTRVAGARHPARPGRVLDCGPDLRLVVFGDFGDPSAASPAVLHGYAAQAAAAFDRQRLRIQAGQAEALAEGNRMRTALLAAVSHDLRTPLASVKAAVTTLRQTDVRWSAADQAALLATIEDGADRLDALIGNLLDMSRIQTGALQPFVRPTALDEVAPLLVHSLDGGQRLRLDIPDQLPLIATDPGLLERALANVAANALRYSPPDQPAVLTATTTGSAVVIEIIDHGPGIPDQNRDRAFQPFQQLDDHHTGDGVGLGLAVAKGFIDALGGHITAAETLGGGVTMRITVPIAAPARQPTA